MRRSIVAPVAAALFIAGAGSAAASAWHGLSNLRSGGVLFHDAHYTFYPKGTQHGGFGFRGKLTDDPDDDNNVYIQAKVEGYSWNRFNGKQRKTVPLNKVVWDGAMLYVRTADIRACRDRGSLHPDNCSTTVHRVRP